MNQLYPGRSPSKARKTVEQSNPCYKLEKEFSIAKEHNHMQIISSSLQVQSFDKSTNKDSFDEILYQSEPVMTNSNTESDNYLLFLKGKYNCEMENNFMEEKQNSDYIAEKKIAIILLTNI